jgi:hypothetical protein
MTVRKEETRRCECATCLCCNTSSGGGGRQRVSTTRSNGLDDDAMAILAVESIHEAMKGKSHHDDPRQLID